jgi:two-component system osmolarity sensor histidine kinase EnvZ
LSVADAAARAGMAADITEMDRTIGQFLDFARPQEGASTAAALTATDLSALLTEIAARYGRHLSFNPPASPVIARIRPDLLRRAIVNLIENALRHGGQGEHCEPVELALTTTGEEVIIAVLDHGPGIAPNEVERLKLPFTRGEAARTGAGGAGLGLTIVDRIVRAQNGRLELLPRSGGGLAAQIHLPRT